MGAGAARRPGEGSALRDYFLARSEQAGLLWIYRERLAGQGGRVAGPMQNRAGTCMGCLPELWTRLRVRLTLSCASRGYAELHCLSNFSFQRGASHPEELVARAHALGYRRLAITDECSVAGVVRAHLEAKKCGFEVACWAPSLRWTRAAGLWRWRMT